MKQNENEKTGKQIKNHVNNLRGMFGNGVFNRSCNY